MYRLGFPEARRSWLKKWVALSYCSQQCRACEVVLACVCSSDCSRDVAACVTSADELFLADTLFFSQAGRSPPHPPWPGHWPIGSEANVSAFRSWRLQNNPAVRANPGCNGSCKHRLQWYCLVIFALTQYYFSKDVNMSFTLTNPFSCKKPTLCSLPGWRIVREENQRSDCVQPRQWPGWQERAVGCWWKERKRIGWIQFQQ